MAAMGLLLIPLLFIVGVVAMAIIPVVVALIYRGSYNRHLNEQLNGDGTIRRWISPLALGLIIFLAEVIIMVGVTVIGMINYSALTGNSSSGEVDFSDNLTESYLPQDLPEEYAVFDGGEVEGYAKEERDQDDFHFIAYKHVDGDKIGNADYVICTDYMGDAVYSQVTSNVQFGTKDGSYGIGTSLEKSNRYYCIIDLGGVVYRNVTNKDGVQTTQEYTLKPDDIDVSYDLLLINIPGGSDIDSFDFSTLTSDTMAGELKIDLKSLGF